MSANVLVNLRPAIGCVAALFIVVGSAGRAGAEGSAAAAGPAGVAQAESYALQAFEAYGRGDFGEAIALYERAYAATPSADALYNIARVADLGVRDRPLSIRAYRRFLSDPGATPERIRQANERLSQLYDAEQAQLESGPVGPPRSRAATGVAAPSAGPASDLDPGGGWSTLQAVGFASGALGVVAAGVGIGFGVAVLNESHVANAYCADNRCTSQRGVAAAKAASTHATIATTGMAAGGALLLTGATLWWLGAGGSSGREARAAEADVRLAPVLSASEPGLTLSGRW
jgi:hypothetical protein